MKISGIQYKSCYINTTIALYILHCISTRVQEILNVLNLLETTPSNLCDLETSASPWFLNPQGHLQSS